MLIYDDIFMHRVLLEWNGWRFEATYEVFFGVSRKYSRLLYGGKDVGRSLPIQTRLLTPIGEFVRCESGWEAVRSDPQIWDGRYRMPALKEGEPWRPQIQDASEDPEFLANGLYRAPKDADSFEAPWTNQQLRGTPADWVYVYRFTLPESSVPKRTGSVVTGYWVDPTHLKGLSWE